MREVEFTKREMEVLAVLAQGDAITSELGKNGSEVVKRINNRARSEIVINLFSPPLKALYRLGNGSKQNTLEPKPLETKPNVKKHTRPRATPGQNRFNRTSERQPIFYADNKPSTPITSKTEEKPPEITITDKRLNKSYLDSLILRERSAAACLSGTDMFSPYTPTDNGTKDAIEAIINNEEYPNGYHVARIISPSGKISYYLRENKKPV